jgi:hypothetical protein
LKLSTKAESGRNSLKPPKKENPSPSPGIFTPKSTKHLRKSSNIILKFFPKNRRKRNTFKLILQGYFHPDTNAKSRQYKKIREDKPIGVIIYIHGNITKKLPV